MMSVRSRMVWFAGVMAALLVLGATIEARAAGKSSAEEIAEKIETTLEQAFEREPLGFSFDTITQLVGKLGEAPGEFAETMGPWWGEQIASPAMLLGVTVVLLLFFVVAFLIDRRSRRSFEKMASTANFRGPPMAQSLMAKVIEIAGRLVVPVSLLVLSLAVFQYVIPSAVWSDLLTRVLFIWVTYRLATGVVRVLVTSPILRVTERHALVFRHALIRAFWLVSAVAMVRSLLQTMEYDQGSIALLIFIERLGLTLIVVRLIWARDAFVDLMPETGSAMYLAIRRLMTRYYVQVMALTAGFGLMWTFGFNSIVETIAFRLYLGVTVLVGCILLTRWASQWLKLEEDESESTNPVRQLAQRAGGILTFFAVVLIAILTFKAFGVYDAFVNLLSTPLFEFGGAPFNALTLWYSLLVLMTFLLASRVIRCALDLRLFPRYDVEEGLAFAISATTHYVILSLGILSALMVTGLNFAALAVFAGALGLGIGLGLQEIFRDVVSGFVILYGQSVRKGDRISVAGEAGTVERVGARSITLKTPDSIELVMPTSSVINGTIVNWTHSSPQIRVHVEVGTTYSADPQRVKQALLEAASSYTKTLQKPAPMVWLVGFGDSAVLYELIVWINAKRYSRREVVGELYFTIWDKLHEADIVIPFPQRDLHIKSIEPELRDALAVAERPTGT